MPSLRKSKHSPCRDKVGAGLRQTGPLAQLNRAFDYGSKGYRFESCGDHKDARLLNTINKSRICFAELAQLVERWLPKPKVTSSSLAFRSQKKRSYSFGDTASSFACQASHLRQNCVLSTEKHFRGQPVLLTRFVHHKGFSVDEAPHNKGIIWLARPDQWPARRERSHIPRLVSCSVRPSLRRMSLLMM